MNNLLFMKASTFSIASAIITIAYSLGCLFYFNQPFWGYTALCVGALVTIYPLYFERQRINLITQTQIAEYLAENLPEPHGKSVIKQRLGYIKNELDSIKSGIVPLTYLEVGEFAELRMREKLSEKSETKYFALHIVDSDKSLNVWGKDYSEYPYLASYVAVQRNILDGGGSVTRLFLFDPDWLKKNVSNCRDAINRHNQLYAGTSKPIRTLCALMRRDVEQPRGDFSILDEKEVFFWERGSNIDTGAYTIGQYIVAPNKVRNHVNKWRNLSDNAFEFPILFKLLDENKL
jgi:hypothetical protein